MPLQSGARLGPYEILSAIGAGGMGEVYKARDTRLDRIVAVKVLPEVLAGDPQFRERFDREARAISQLDHPHICALYDVGDQDGTAFLVMQYLEGETLADRLAKGALPLEQALKTAIEIASALDKAHRAGITHRDLKPGNIMLTKVGAKLLDFGLAKAGAGGAGRAVGPGPAVALSMLSTTPPNLTVQGTILGTFQYMAPEQLEGQEADARSDIFAFGAVLYEMLTGKKAFEDKSHASLIAAIMHAQPTPLAVYQPLSPPLVEHIVMRCLAKEPDERWQSASDVMRELTWIVGAGSQASAPAAFVAPTRGFASSVRFAWIVATTALIAAIVFSIPAIRHVREMPVQSREMRLEINTPPTDDLVSLAISPDGHQLAFVATSEGRTRLWIRPLDSDSTHARPLAGTDGATLPFWSPDNKRLGFFAGGRLRTINVTGGPTQVLASAVLSRGGTWNADDVIVFQATGGNTPLLRIPAKGGSPAPVIPLAANQSMNRFPWFLPDGRHFLYFANGSAEARGVYVAALDAPTGRRLCDADTAAIYAPPGYLVFARQGTLVAQRFDIDRLQVVGDSLTVAEQVAVDLISRGAGVSASTTGVVLFRNARGIYARQLAWFDRTGVQTTAVGTPDSTLANVELASDGTRVAVDREVEGNRDIWLIDTRRGHETRLSTDSATDMKPIWSFDGLHVLFNSNRSNVAYNIYQRLASSAGADEPLSPSTADTFGPDDWSRDGRFLLYERYTPQTGRDLWTLPMTGGGRAFPVVKSEFEERDGQFSPDGRWIAYGSDQSGRHEVYVQPFPGPGGASRVSTMGGVQPRWRGDGRELFYVAPDGRLMATPMTLADEGQAIEAGAPTALFATHIAGGTVPGANKHQYAVAADGRRFLINVETQESSAAPITIILNWQAALGARERR